MRNLDYAGTTKISRSLVPVSKHLTTAYCVIVLSRCFDAEEAHARKRKRKSRLPVTQCQGARIPCLYRFARPHVSWEGKWCIKSALACNVLVGDRVLVSIHMQALYHQMTAIQYPAIKYQSSLMSCVADTLDFTGSRPSTSTQSYLIHTQ